MRRFPIGIAVAVLLVAAAALMQGRTLAVAGVAPNLILLTLLISGFFIDSPAVYIALTLLASVLARATPSVFDPVSASVFVVGVLGFFAERRLVWPSFVGTVMLSAGATVAAYLLVQPSFLWTSFGAFAGELLYNVVVGLVLFAAYKFFFGDTVRR